MNGEHVEAKYGCLCGFDAAKGEGSPDETAGVWVEGDTLTTTLWQFEQRASVLLSDEQSKANPDNALIGFICDAMRLARENAKMATGLGAVIEAERRAVEPTRELTLLDFGYAPGNYTIKCHDCGQKAVADKRALRCETCAAQALRENRSGAVKAIACNCRPLPEPPSANCPIHGDDICQACGAELVADTCDKCGAENGGAPQ